MPAILLTPSVVEQTVCSPSKRKTDLFDTQTKGLLLEVRQTGGKTYYLRYQDHRGDTRQLRLADARDISLSQARQLADKARNKIAMGEDPCEEKAAAKKVPTFSAFFEEQYLPYIKSYKRSWDTDECLIRKHLLPRFGKKHLDEITKQDVIRMHSSRRAEGCAPASANRLLILTRFMYNLAQRWEVPGVKSNPADKIPYFEENNKIERFLTLDETKRVYEAVCVSDNPMLKYIVPMLILTGARKREVLDAKWEQFDFTRRSWRIPLTKSGKARHVPLSDGALTLLAQTPNDNPHGWVFPNPATGIPFTAIFYSWDTARKQAGIPELRIHDLRHSFASMLVNNGRTLYEVQAILGHRSSKTTQRYAHLANDTLIDAANAASRAVAGLMVPNLQVIDMPASPPDLIQFESPSVMQRAA